MAKLFILDDQKVRHELFELKYQGHDITAALTAKEAIDILRNNQFDYIFLDHDLGGQAFVASEEGTGYEVAEWISQHPEFQTSYIIIHSFNPAGCANMYNVLAGKGFRRVMIDPFPCKSCGPVPIKDKRL
jgi:CheY-like chemotaxis protein